MRRLLLLLLTVSAAVWALDDPWTAVTKLKSGTEIRVTKKGSTQPVVGKFDQADDSRLLLVVKNAQVSIPKDQVDRVEARAAQPGGRVKAESKTTTSDPQAAHEPEVGMETKPNVPGMSTNTSVQIGGKPDYETVYRRPTGGPKNVEVKK